MIEKSLSVPSASRYALRFPLSDLKRGGSIRGVHLAHMKEEDGALVCAEAIHFYFRTLKPLGILFSLPHELLAASEDSETVYSVPTAYSNGNFQDLQCNINYLETLEAGDGFEGTILVQSKQIHRYANTTAIRTITDFGGTCGARHSERIFIGDGRTIHYSEPLQYRKWNYSAFNRGDLTLFPDQGDIVGMVSFREKLYLFFERGIQVLTAFADPLNFSVKAFPFGLGTSVKNSFVNCGEAVYFFTDRGLCKLDGTNSQLVESIEYLDINLSEPLRAFCYHNEYYASVCNRKGERILFGFDPVNGRSRYINHVCHGAAANNTFYISSGNQIYELWGKSFPTVGECALTVDLRLDDKPGTKYLESVTVSGSGNITAVVTNAKGECVSVKGECGKRLRLPCALRGEDIRLKVLPEDEEFAIRELSFEVRRDECGN